jgi:Tfp pilus assembly protein PilN
MHDINLIPQKTNEKKTEKSIFTFIVLIGICAIIAVHGYEPYIQWRQLKSHYNNQRKLLEQYDAINQDFDRLSKDLTELEKKKNSLSGIIGNKHEWSDILSKIERGIPPSTVLTSMFFNDPSLTIEGNCPTDIETAQLAIYLQDTGLFKNVKIDSIIEDTTSRRCIFVINCFFDDNTNVENTHQDISTEEGDG